MSLFNHKIGLQAIIREIPDLELNRLSKETAVDYCSKVLKGKLIFYLLLYGMLRIDRLGQRGLADAFSSPMFRLVFNIDKKKKRISHSSLSERLSVIELRFFEKSYDILYKRLNSLYTKKEIAGKYLQRVDSSLVAEAGNKLLEGMTCGNEYTKKKMIKYTINFNGMFASFSSIHHQESYANESLALPENVLNHFRKEKDHACVYIFDRGQSSGKKYGELHREDGLQFIGRLSENRKLDIVKDLLSENAKFENGDLLEDNLVRIYGTEHYINSKGNPQKKQVLLPEEYRVVRFKSKAGKEILLITNILDLDANTIAQMYKRRWDIEVFFRFLKQELNFSHFLSLNQNGIQVIMYMTLITAMLVMIYKKENEIGYKTAVRRMSIELENMVMAIIVVESGGDLRKVDLPEP